MFSTLVHLILSLSISYPYLLKFHYFADNSQERMKHQMGGCNSGPTGHDFPHNSIIYFLFSTMRTGPFSRCENLSGSHWTVFTSNENLQFNSHGGSHFRFSLRTGLKTHAGFQQVGENRPTLVSIRGGSSACAFS
jgi:hypothetical protein